MNSQSGRCTGRQKDEQAVKKKAVMKMYKQTERWTASQEDVQAGRKMNRQTGRCTDRHEDEQPVRKMNSQSGR
jgi:hypothetical protein